MGLKEILITAVIIAGIYFAINIGRWLEKQSDRHGSAELEKNRSFLSTRNKGLVINGRNRISEKASFKHTIILGPTGTGKSVIYFMNALLQSNGSKIVTDIKGELWRTCSGYLKEVKGYDVQVIDLANIEQSFRYNPLKRLVTEIDIRKFCETVYDMYNGTSSRTEGIWKRGAMNCIEIIVRCLIQIDNQEYRTMANLIYLVGKLGSQEGCKELEGFIVKYGRRGSDRSTIDLFTNYRQQESKVMSGQHSEAMAALAQFNTQELKLLMSDDDIDFGVFRQKPTVLFLKVPASTADAYAPFLTLFYSQFFDYLLDEEPAPKSQSIYFLLDEFSNLRPVGNFAEVISLIRSKHVSLSIGVQGLLQLEKVYGKIDSEIILDNCGTHLLLPGIMNVSTLRHYENLIGISTRQEEDENGKMIISRRPVLTADEIRRIEDNEALLIHGNKNATRLKTYPLYKNLGLMVEARLKSKHGRFVPQIEPVRMSTRKDENLVLIDLVAFNHSFERKLATISRIQNSTNTDPSSVNRATEI